MPLLSRSLARWRPVSRGVIPRTAGRSLRSGFGTAWPAAGSSPDYGIAAEPATYRRLPTLAVTAAVRQAG